MRGLFSLEKSLNYPSVKFRGEKKTYPMIFPKRVYPLEVKILKSKPQLGKTRMRKNFEIKPIFNPLDQIFSQFKPLG